MFGPGWNNTFISSLTMDRLTFDEAIEAPFHYHAIFPKIVGMLTRFTASFTLPKNDLSTFSAFKNIAFKFGVG